MCYKTTYTHSTDLKHFDIHYSLWPGSLSNVERLAATPIRSVSKETNQAPQLTFVPYTALVKHYSLADSHSQHCQMFLCSNKLINILTTSTHRDVLYSNRHTHTPFLVSLINKQSCSRHIYDAAYLDTEQERLRVRDRLTPTRQG